MAVLFQDALRLAIPLVLCWRVYCIVATSAGDRKLYTNPLV